MMILEGYVLIPVHFLGAEQCMYGNLGTIILGYDHRKTGLMGQGEDLLVPYICCICYI